jgi:hypothetical protein
MEPTKTSPKQGWKARKSADNPQKQILRLKNSPSTLKNRLRDSKTGREAEKTAEYPKKQSTG